MQSEYKGLENWGGGHLTLTFDMSVQIYVYVDAYYLDVIARPSYTPNS